ncbi:MAG TPA: hypothetical protein IAC97_04525 [Candidatus Pelethousia gallinarum]|nr:hypothetical protein [Candidatus Pelethousia gallinarum]
METPRETYDALFEEVAREIPPQPEQRQLMDKTAWAAEQKALREELYALADRVADRVLSDPAALRQFIETQARLGGESAVNTLILMEKYPEAARTHTFEEWKRMGRSIQSGEQAIALLARGREYVREDGTTGVFMRIRKVFDVRQTTGRSIKQRPVHAVYNRIKALLTDTPVPVCLSEDVPANVGAVYLSEKGTVNVARSLDGNALFFSVAREMARAGDCSSTFPCDCVANILCSRYHMEPRYPDRIPEAYANLEPKAKRAVLADIRQTAWLIERRMDRNLDRLVNPREKQQDTPER